MLLVSLFFVLLQQLSKDLKFTMTRRTYSDNGKLVLLNLFDHLKLAISAFITHELVVHDTKCSKVLGEGQECDRLVSYYSKLA